MSDGIVSQNKDVLMKILSENYKNKSLKAYGLELPKIKQILPTNLPILQVNEKRSDNIFLLEDDTILILEYESSFNSDNLVKYGHYAFRVSMAYKSSENIFKKIRIVVIYTGDTKKASNTLDLGCVKLEVEQVFLAQFNHEEILLTLKNKIENKETLTDEEVLRFIILPLMAKGKKQPFIEETIELAQKIDDDSTQNFIIAGILVASDKFIDKEYSLKVKEWLTMTKIGRLFEEEKIEYAKEKIDEIATNLIKQGVDIELIAKATGLEKEEVIKIKDSLKIKS